MKRFFIFAALGTITLIVSDASGFDSRAEQMEALIKNYPVELEQAYAPVIESPAVLVEILNPALASNFNRLVVFAELGSGAELRGFASGSRGPPKSQVFNGLTLYNDQRRFSINARTRLR